MWQDLRSALRTLSRTRGVTFVAIITLAFGIGGSTLIFSLVYGVLLRPLPYPQADRLVMLWQHDPARGIEQERVTPANFADWRSQNRVFDEMAYMPAWRGSRWWNLVGDNGHERVTRAWVSSRFFRALGVMPSVGRAFTDAEDEPDQSPTVIISYALWQRLFGGAPDVIGRTLTFDSIWRTRHTVVGVMPPGFTYPDGTETWVPIGTSEIRAPAPNASRRCCPWLEVIARLAPGITIAEAQAHMDVIAARLARSYPDVSFATGVKVVALQELAVGAVRPTLVVLLGAVSFVLLIACANVANLLLVRARARQREIGIRVALGASRSRLWRQLLVESVMLSGMGGLLGVALAAAGLPILAAAFGGHIPRLEEVGLSHVVLLFSGALSMATGILFGLAPAAFAANGSPAEALKDSGSLGSSVRGTRVRHALVVLQVAVAFVLLAGAGLLTRSLLQIQRLDAGYVATNLLTGHIDMTAVTFEDGRSHRFLAALMTRLAQLPGVRAVAGASTLPLIPGGRPMDLIRADRHDTSNRLSATWCAITPDYFRALGTPLPRGRAFTERDDGDHPNVAIINESMAHRYWPGVDPIGDHVYYAPRDVMYPRKLDPNDRIEIVGVVANMRTKAVTADPQPEVYFPYTQYPWHEAQIVIRTVGDTKALSRQLSTEARALNRAAVISQVQPMEAIVADATARPRLGTFVLSLFASVGLLLTAVGMAGVVSYAVTQRSREIGLRIALGASGRSVLLLVVREALLLTAAGLALGLVGATALTGVLQRLLFAVSPLDPATLASALVLLAAVALGAAAAPAWRAARVNPLIALRRE
ncbi:MAG: ABC transporter permease [Vicinamibacteraceae bacterium]